MGGDSCTCARCNSGDGRSSSGNDEQSGDGGRGGAAYDQWQGGGDARRAPTDGCRAWAGRSTGGGAVTANGAAAPVTGDSRYGGGSSSISGTGGREGNGDRGWLAFAAFAGGGRAH